MTKKHLFRLVAAILLFQRTIQAQAQTSTTPAVADPAITMPAQQARYDAQRSVVKEGRHGRQDADASVSDSKAQLKEQKRAVKRQETQLKEQKRAASEAHDREKAQKRQLKDEKRALQTAKDQEKAARKQ